MYMCPTIIYLLCLVYELLYRYKLKFTQCIFLNSNNRFSQLPKKSEVYILLLLEKSTMTLGNQVKNRVEEKIVLKKNNNSKA